MVPSIGCFFETIIESDAEILGQVLKHIKNEAYLKDQTLAVKLWNNSKLSVQRQTIHVVGSDSRPSLDQYLQTNQHLQLLLFKSSVHATASQRFEGTRKISMDANYFEAEWHGQKVSGVGVRGLLFAVCKSVLFPPTCESSDCRHDLLGDDFDYETDEEADMWEPKCNLQPANMLTMLSHCVHPDQMEFTPETAQICQNTGSFPLHGHGEIWTVASYNRFLHCIWRWFTFRKKVCIHHNRRHNRDKHAAARHSVEFN
jgi:hypothetical protein